MDDSFNIKQDLSLSELYKVNLIFLFRNKKYRRIYYFILIGGIVLTFSEFLSSKPHWINAIGTFLIGVFFPLLFVVAGTLLLCVIFYYIKPSSHKGSYVFNQWGMYKIIDKAEYSNPWKNFTRWEETRSFIFLYISENNAHVIPKRNLDKEELDRFKRFLVEKFGLFS